MADSAIKVRGVGKQYQLGRGYGADSQLSSKIDAAFRKPVRFLTGKRGAPPEHDRPAAFWALRDVSFDVAPGEVVGLVGANGAGKSTLLKLLARITAPTEGRIELRGLVGSLLEVGTGFHPDLTGRDNIFLNGAILGMRRKEIMARYNEIVEFSEIPDFIGTPVKRYSSGMFVRLAFSVAAFLQPEILLVDEVLAVGDAAFQRKCLAKMEDVVRNEGRTIVFVSHNMSSVRKLCSRVLLIEEGRLMADGPSDEIISGYMGRVRPVQHGGVSVIAPEGEREGTGEARATTVSLLDDNGELMEEVLLGQPFTVAVDIQVDEALPAAAVLVGISDADGARVLTSSSIDRDTPAFQLQPGKVRVKARIETTLLPGEFAVDVAVVEESGTTVDYVERVISFTSRNLAADGSGDHYPFETIVGRVRPDTGWTIDKADRVLESGAPAVTEA